jgi:hypothetical protein
MVRAQAPAIGMRRFVPIAALAVAVVAGVGCYATGLLPVLAMQAALLQAGERRMTDAERVAKLMEAQNADPFSAEAPMKLAELSMDRLRRDPKSSFWQMQFLDASSAAIAQAGHSSAVWRQLANWNRELYKLAPTKEAAERIAEYSRSAAFLYPNSAVIQGEYALALADVGKDAAARRSAEKALALDAATPHADKKLSAQLKARLESLAAEAKKSTATPSGSALVE